MVWVTAGKQCNSIYHVKAKPPRSAAAFQAFISDTPREKSCRLNATLILESIIYFHFMFYFWGIFFVMMQKVSSYEAKNAPPPPEEDRRQFELLQ